MRRTFDPVVESGRDLAGPFRSNPGERQGGFRLYCPDTRRELTVIVSDGSGWKQGGLPGEPWEHVSVSTKDRVPLWAEMVWIKGLFFTDEECVVEYHPPRSVYKNVHPNVLHLWRATGVAFPMPPVACV